jgi:hypothetical protein
MSEDAKERLERKEQHRNPGGILNDAISRANTGSPTGGCFINLLSVIIIVVFIFLIRSCSN